MTVQYHVTAELSALPARLIWTLQRREAVAILALCQHDSPTPRYKLLLPLLIMCRCSQHDASYFCHTSRPSWLPADPNRTGVPHSGLHKPGSSSCRAPFPAAARMPSGSVASSALNHTSFHTRE